jgi:hypothetical protein
MAIKKRKKLTKAKAILKPTVTTCGTQVFIELSAFSKEVLDAIKRHKLPGAVADTNNPSRCKVLLVRPDRYADFEECYELLLAAILDIRRTEKQGVCHQYHRMICDGAKTIVDLEQNLHNNKHSLKRELRDGKRIIDAIDFKLLEKHAEVQKNS